jgi:tetratricopeptide (TPR) repeat protein
MSTQSPAPSSENDVIVSLRAAPAAIPALVALVLLIVWATDQAGFPLTHWAPGGLIVLVLLAIAVGAVGIRLKEVVIPVRIALACLAGYTALSFLSILWAHAQAVAWEGADRTLLYLLVFALFACFGLRGPVAAALLGFWVLAMIAVAGYVAIHIDAASGHALQASFGEGRLEYPSGYPNANAAEWLMAFWPAVLMARSSHLHAALRGLLAGGAVLLADIALLSQSRGSLYATPVMLLLVFALAPGRMRCAAVLAPVLAGVAAAAPTLLRVGDRLHGGQVTHAAVHTAVLVSFAGAIVVGLLVAAGARLERSWTPADSVRARVRVASRAAVATGLAIALVAGLLVFGNPAARISHAWNSFKGGYGADSTTGSRLVSGLGSNRYDFYRVALDEFAKHPLLGIGADNFQQQYLVHGRSEETPHYPHSIELRTLSQTGVVGSLLALVGLAAALVATAGALRGEDRLARTVAAAALAAFAYWVVHGSFDWFWEFAGLGAPAFALLGLACGLRPARALTGETSTAASGRLSVPGSAGEPTRHGARGRRRVLVGLGCSTAIAAAVSLTLPWLSQLEVESATRIWTKAPTVAYARLANAARMNPLSDEADLVAGSIAVRFGELARAQHDFSAALRRNPGDAYATLELGAIASARGMRATALELLERAERLNPRDSLTRQALMVVRRGRRVSIAGLNRLILIKAQLLS